MRGDDAVNLADILTSILSELPGQDELASLPRLALVAYGARCARRIRAGFGTSPLDSTVIDKALDVADSMAAGKEHPVGEASPALDGFIQAAEENAAAARPGSVGNFYATQTRLLGGLTEALLTADSNRISEGCRLASQMYVLGGHLGAHEFHKSFELPTANDVVYARGQDAERVDRTLQQATDALKHGLKYTSACETAARIASHALSRDYVLLRESSVTDAWEDDTPVAPNFFAVRSEFDIPREGAHPTLIEVGELLKVEFADYFVRNPNRLRMVSPREFETLVASLLKGFGFEVELTARTRDGGRDVIAVSVSPANIKLLIECKHYRADRSVGVALVRQLHGVVEDEGATKGILVTTGKLTQPAREHLHRNRWQLEARDFEGLVEWLRDYQSLQIERISRMIRTAGSD